MGDGTDVTSLSKAGASRADVLVATTSADEDNITACQLASLRFGTPRTLTVVNESERSRLVDMLRINTSIDVTDLAVNRIQEFLFVDGMVQQLPMPGDDTRSLLVARVPRNSAMDGRPVSDLDLPNGSSISLLIGRDGRAQIPDQSTVIRSDDEIVAVGDRPDTRDAQGRSSRTAWRKAMTRRVAFLGPAGTFTEQAAIAYDPNASFVAMASVDETVLAMQAGRRRRSRRSYGE